MKLSDILFESGNKWVIKNTSKGEGCYEVWENGTTHAVKRATVQYSNDNTKAFNRACEECKK